MEYLFGFAAGMATSACLYTLYEAWVHDQWCKLVDRQQALLEKMAARLKRPKEDAERWKEN